MEDEEDYENTSPITKAILEKEDSERMNDEKWDKYLTDTVNKVENWKREKQGNGPEPSMSPVNSSTAEATIYADDNSAGEVASTVEELKRKTEKMLDTIFGHMRASRLLINSDKTGLMLFATPQKRSKNNLEFSVNVDGLRIKEIESARLLGVTLSNTFSWNAHVDLVIEKCSKRLNGLYKVQRQLSEKQRKNLAEGAILSRLKYSIEVVSAANEKNIKRLESMQSKAARFCLMKSRKEWSRTEGYNQLNWLTIPQAAVEASLRTFFRIISLKKPEKLYHSLYDEEKDSVKQLSSEDLEKMTRLSRRSWRTRVLRYALLIPDSFFTLNVRSLSFKMGLKEWVKLNIYKDGDFIFHGKVKPPSDNDWLVLELESWKEKEKHEEKSAEEYSDISRMDME